MRLLGRLVLLSFMVAAGCSSAAVDARTVTAIRTALPKGWKVTADDRMLIVERESSDTAKNNIGTAAPEPCAVVLFLNEYVSPEHYKELRRQNDEIARKGHELWRSANMNKIPHDPGMCPLSQLIFHPRNKEEEDAVARFKALYASQKALPEFYLNEQSFSRQVLINPGGPEKRDPELDAVHEKVMSLFREYED